MASGIETGHIKIAITHRGLFHFAEFGVWVYYGSAEVPEVLNRLVHHGSRN